MRPVIPEVMVNRIEQVQEQQGYESASEYVRDAVRRQLEHHERQQKIPELSETVEESLDIEVVPKDFVVYENGAFRLSTSAQQREGSKRLEGEHEADS